MGFLAVVKAVVLVIAGLVAVAASIHDVRSQRAAKEAVVSPVMILGLIVGGLVLANVLFGKKPGEPAPTLIPGIAHSAPPQAPFSIRQQQADEAAAAVASYFRRADEEAWVEEQIERAQSYFSRGKPSTSSKS